MTTQCDITHPPTSCSTVSWNTNQGGNCLSDSFIASQSGEIYFSSLEQLDGTHGLPNQENLYVYRNGRVQWVTTLTGPPHCVHRPYYSFENYCPRIMRMEVSPDGSHMAFITGNQVAQSQYDSDGHLEMYTYEPSSGKIVCVSCLPSGAPPTSDVLVQSGRPLHGKRWPHFPEHRRPRLFTATPTTQRTSMSTSTVAPS